MNCKFCNAELEEGVTLCPVCGKDNTQEPEAELTAQEPEEAVADVAVQPEAEVLPAEETAEKKGGFKLWQVLLAIFAGAVLLAGLAAIVLVGMGVEIKLPKNDIFRKESYSTATPEKTGADVVAKVGDKKLTNSQLQIHYWSQVYDFLNYFSGYLDSVGLDITKPLDQQDTSVEEGKTWQQYFLETTLNTWHRYQTLALMAQEEGYTLSEEYQTALDNTPEQMQQLAAQYGYTDVDEMLEREMGPGVTIDDYMEYMELSYIALQYYQDKYDALTPTEQEIEVYFTAHEAEYLEKGITKESGDLIDVRHILICPTGGQEDADGKVTYSDDEWETCRQKAQALLDQWVEEGAKEDAFAKLAGEHSEDGGSKANGGLYSQVQKGQMVPAFNDWIFDETRKYGDYGLVKTEYGYHIMFFVNGQEAWYYNAKTGLIAELSNQFIEEGMERFPMKINYKKINLGAVDFTPETGSAETQPTTGETTTEPTTEPIAETSVTEATE